MLTIHTLIHIAIKFMDKAKESSYHRSWPHHDQQKEYATFILGERSGHSCLLYELESYYGNIQCDPTQALLLWEEVIYGTFQSVSMY